MNSPFSLSHQEMQSLAAQAIDKIPIAVLVLDAEARMLYANKVASEIWGEVKYRSLADLSKYSAWEISGAKISDPNQWAAVEALQTGEAVLNQELRIKTFDGKQKSILNSAIPIKNSRNEVTHCVIINQDITQLRNSQEELAQTVVALSEQIQQVEMFKQAVDQAAEHIVITDVDGIVIYANLSVERVTGFSREEVVGTKAGKLWSKPMSSSFYTQLWKTIKHDKQIFHGEIINRKRSGEEYTALTTITPILDADGAVQYFLAFERDISHQKKIDQAKTEFVSFASHQLRTPLTAVKWYTEMLLEGDAGMLSDRQQQFLVEISEGTERMVQLVSALLNVSRIEMGTFQVEPKPLNVLSVIQQVVRDLEPESKPKRVVIQIESEAMPETNLDENLLTIIFHNLLSNGVKYSFPDSQVAVQGKFFAESEEFYGEQVPAQSIAFSVRDEGIGIPENQQDQIFSKLFRADNAMTHDTAGSGLGLYITQAILSTFGGKIWFTSEENSGSTFSFYLPTQVTKRSGTKQLESAHE